MEDDQVDGVSPESDTENADTVTRGMKWSLAGLAVGIVALALASIPYVLFDQPLPNPFARSEPEEDPAEIEPPAEREGGITLRYKNLSVNLGGKVPADEEEEGLEGEDPPLFDEVPKEPVKEVEEVAKADTLSNLK